MALIGTVRNVGYKAVFGRARSTAGRDPDDLEDADPGREVCKNHCRPVAQRQ